METTTTEELTTELTELRRRVAELEASEAERRRIEAALARHNRELALLNRASRALSATLDLDRVLATVLEEMRHLLDVAACSVWLIEPTTEELVCLQATGPQNDKVRGWRLAPGEGLTGWVVHSGESLIVPDAQADERYSEDIEQRTGLTLSSILTVPLRAKRKVIGVLQIVDTNPGRFGPEDLELAESLAASASVAIENARLHRQLRDYAGLLEQRVQERTAQLQAQYARLDAILYSTTDGIVVTDDAGNIIQANPVAQKLLVHTLAPEEAARLRGAVQRVVTRMDEQPVELLELVGLDLELRAAPISQAGVNKAASVVDIHDISHLKALDRMKTRFVSNVSHELRTPVTTIKLYTHLLRRQPQKWEQYLDALAQEADRQAQLVEDILAISRLETGRLELELQPTSLNALVDTVSAGRRVLAQEQGLALENRPAERDPVALADSERLAQVLHNLVENGIRYTSEGGTVTVSTGRKEVEGRVWATVEVSDTGMGIPAEELPHIFDRFFRGERPQAMQLPGTGLGLAIVKEIVDLHGGRVTVKSEENAGSTFTVLLPLVDWP